VPDDETPLLTLNARGKSLMDLHEVIKADIKTHGIKVIVLDSISRAGAGGMVKDDVANLITDSLNNFGTAWIAIGHSPREDSSHVFGSQMFDAAADVVVRTMGEKKETTIGMVMEVIKDNDIGFQPKEFVAYEFNEYGLCTFRKADTGEFNALDEKVMSDLQKIVEHLKRHGASAPKQVEDFTNVKANTVSHYFTSRKDLFVLIASSGKTRAYGLLQND
jgi:hypothetical protein